jgi:hypothetical protein
MRYVVDLDGHGVKFFDAIRNLGIGYREPYNQSEHFARQKFVFNESASQIAMIVDSNPTLFLTELQKLPNPIYFEHHEEFSDPRIAAAFNNAFREFALGIYDRIRIRVGLHFHWDYLLEAITETYMVICVIDKSKGTPS